MKLTTLLLVIVCLHVSAATRSQTVTLHVEKQPITNVLTTIEAQTGYLIIYNDRYVKPDLKVSVNVENQPLEAVLDMILVPQSLTYQIEGKTIAVSRLERKIGKNRITTHTQKNTFKSLYRNNSDW